MSRVDTPVKKIGQWITLKEVKPYQTLVAGYALRFEVSSPTKLAVQVAADQQYALFCDGVMVGRGAEGGDLDNWFWTAHTMAVKPGSHVLAALVWSWGGRRSSMGQMSAGHGFYLSSPDPRTRRLLATGQADWRAKPLPGIFFTEHHNVPNGWTGVPPSQTWDGRKFPWDWVDGQGFGWRSARVRDEKASALTLKPGALPDPMGGVITTGQVVFVSRAGDASDALRSRDNRASDHKVFQPLFRGCPVTVPARTRRRIVVDLGNYYCAFPELTASGGAGTLVKIRWAESLFENREGMEKGQRDEVLGKYFRGIWDACHLDGGTNRRILPLSWRAGRFLEFTIETADQPAELKLELRETRYPLEIKGGFSCDDRAINGIAPAAIRALEMSAHDHLVDCPYYERLAYGGDGRLESLATYVLAGDDLLARKALGLFASSAQPNGLCMSRWPSRVVQYIPSFSLWWVCLVHDFAWWRGDKSVVRAALPAMRTTLAYFLSRLNADGLYREKGKAWNFVDWVPQWNFHHQGGAPFSERGVTPIVNWILAYTLGLAASVEDYAGSARQADIYRAAGRRIGDRLKERFWQRERKLFGDDREGNWISEHTQVMAILAGQVEGPDAVALLDRLVAHPERAKCSLFFTHYAMEAAYRCGHDRFFFDRLKPWQEFSRRGFSTAPENFEDTRSDCHGWGVHAQVHLINSVAGIRPAAMGFASVEVAPRLGKLRQLEAVCLHPRGAIAVEIKKRPHEISAMLDLPKGVMGEFRFGLHKVALRPGRQTVRVSVDPKPRTQKFSASVLS